MKIRTFHNIENNVYISRIFVEDLSLDDKELIKEFGEPTINIGGLFYLWDEISGYHTSDTISDYLIDNRKNNRSILDFKSKDIVGRPIINVTKNKVGIVAGWTEDPTYDIFVAFHEPVKWDYGDMYIMPPVEFKLSDRHQRLVSQGCFFMKFDARDYYDKLSFKNFEYIVPEYYKPLAQLMIQCWSNNIVQRIKNSIYQLRNKVTEFYNEFDREEVLTIK